MITSRAMGHSETQKLYVILTELAKLTKEGDHTDLVTNLLDDSHEWPKSISRDDREVVARQLLAQCEDGDSTRELLRMLGREVT